MRKYFSIKVQPFELSDHQKKLACLLFYLTPEAAVVPSRATQPIYTRQASCELTQDLRQAQAGLGHPGSGVSWSRNPKCEQWRVWWARLSIGSS